VSANQVKSNAALVWTAVAGGAVILGIALAGFGAGYSIAARDADYRVENAKNMATEKAEKATRNLLNNQFSQETTALKAEHAEMVARVRSAAKAEGYESGVSASERAYLSDELQTEKFAKLLAILRSPEVSVLLPKETNQAFDQADASLRTGDIEAAFNAVPNTIELSNRPECIQINKDVIVRDRDVFELCEPQMNINIRNASFNDTLSAYVDGSEIYVDLGRKVDLTDDCTIFYVRNDGRNKKNGKATIRIDCGAAQ
jgi:hypothetical protein